MPSTFARPAGSCRGCSRAASALAAAALAAWLAAPPARAAGQPLPECARPETFAASALPADRAPRIVLLQGALGIVTMAPLGEFLALMGYPARQLADPRTGAMTTDSDVDGRELAGMLAWQYEHDGVRPMIVGHSKGGGVVIDTLRALAGLRGAEIPVVDARTGAVLPRDRFVDPLTGKPEAVTDLHLPYAAAIATGRMPRILRGQFELARVLRDVPDSARAFTGFTIPFDPIAGAFAGDEDPYRALGTARVRNVVLPATTSHIGAPLADHLARDAATRDWIERYRPGTDAPWPQDADTSNLILAAELWYDVKRAWCGEAARAGPVHAVASHAGNG